MIPLIPFTIGALSRGFVHYASQTTVTGVERFLALVDEGRRTGRGLLTVSNHTSMLDDPLMWGALPLWTFKDPRTIRTTLGAADMMFNGRLDSWFFRRGQVIKTVRGDGIYQAAMDEAREKLESGGWIHIFPEGRINQERRDPENDVDPWIRRFKWGVSRLLLESEELPLIVPVWIRGFDSVMSEEASFPRRIPRPFKSLTVAFGEPLNNSIEPVVRSVKATLPPSDVRWQPAVLGRGREIDMAEEPESLAPARIKISSVLRDLLVDFGRQTRPATPQQPVALNDIVKETAHLVSDLSESIKRETKSKIDESDVGGAKSRTSQKA